MVMSRFPLVAHLSPDQVVAWHQGIAISLNKFLGDVAHLAAMLPAGVHMLNLCSDRYHFTVGLAAAIVSGKISLLPPTITPETLRQLQAFSADVFCLHDGDHAAAELQQLRYPVMPDSYPAALQIPQIDSRQPAAILFTSGSSSAPLPHPKSWGSLVRNVRAQAERLELPGSAAIIGTVPPQHMYGLESTVLLALQNGHALSSAHPFYPADICSAIEAVPMPCVLVSTPVHLKLLLDAELDIPKVEMILSATAPLSAQLAVAVETRFNAPLLEIYGSTETGQIATRRSTQTSEWQLFPDLRMTRRDERMWASGGHVEIAAALNDIIETTTNNCFLLHGRMADMVNIAGKRSSLNSLNQQLNAIPGVLDGAFYMPEETSHDHVTRLSACVVAPTLSRQALIAALRKRIDPVFLPRPLLFVTALPRNSTGKLPREALRTLIENSRLETSSSDQPA